MVKRLWTAAALAIAGLGPIACSEPEPAADAAPEAPAGITASNGVLALPAVAGNPGAVYFDIANAGDGNMVVRAVSVAGASSAMLHNAEMQELTQVMVPPGETVKFAPGGQHVMAMQLDDTVKAGGTAEVTVTFVGGDKVSFPAEVRAAGDVR
jgi:copper(I)-binding protein